MYGKRGSKRYLGVFFVVFVLIIAPIDFSYFSVAPRAIGETLQEEDIVEDTVWSENKVVQGMVFVEPGVTLTIKKGVVVEFDGRGGIDVFGNLVVEGTPAEPVVVKKKDPSSADTYSIRAISGDIFVRNARISDGGSAGEVFIIGQRTHWNRAVAQWVYTGAFSALIGGSLDIEGVVFHNNVVAVHMDSASYLKVKIWRSKFHENELDIVNQSFQGKVDVRYNWWQSENGPVACVTECQDKPRVYEKIIGGINALDWAKSEFFKDPVIVIPGIMGSWRKTDGSNLELDPLLGTYDELLETMDENGYAMDVDLFPFPYEWRVSNVTTAKLLKIKIDAVKATAKWPKVDIVAHSMGGLVAREYIRALNGANNIDQLITLGTPHGGSVKSYLTWEGGEFGRRFGDFLLENIFKQEAEENGYDSFFDYVRNAPIASVQELLPASSYLRDKDSGEMRVYPNLHPKNAFLENLKNLSSLSKLEPVLFSNIVGNLGDSSTITKLRVEGASVELLNNPDNIILWGHGKPDGYGNILSSDHGMELGSGDGTVPVDSGRSIISDEIVELVSSHDNLPTDSAKIVVKILTGHDALSNQVLNYPEQSLLLFMPFSPIDIQIVSPSGKRVGKNFDTGGFVNEIPGAYYTGYDTINEFVTIPHPEQGEYKILKQGTGSGTYRVEAVHIAEDASGEVQESVATMTGVAEENVITEDRVELKETGEVVLETTQDAVAPETTATIVGTTGTNRWYKSDVTVTLSATDNEGGSGVAKSEYSVDGGTTWSIYREPFVLSEEDNVALQYFSTDTTGNKETIKTETIKIDKTAPEAKIMFNHTTQKLDVEGSDKGGGSVASILIEQKRDIQKNNAKLEKIKPWFERWWRIYGKRLPDMLVVLTDEAGHTTTVFFEKLTSQKTGSMTIRVKSLTYDDGREHPIGATSQYDWQIDKHNEYQQLMARLGTSTKILESRYRPQEHETWIRERMLSSRPDYLLREKKKEKDEDRYSEWQKLPSLIVPYLVTNKGQIETKY